MKLIELIKDRTVIFQWFRDNHFIYKVDFPGGLFFEIPLKDVGTATLKDKDKAIYFMRWIKKAFERKNKSEEENGPRDFNEFMRIEVEPIHSNKTIQDLGFENLVEDNPWIPQEVKITGDINKAINIVPFIDMTNKMTLDEALAKQEKV